MKKGLQKLLKRQYVEKVQVCMYKSSAKEKAFRKAFVIWNHIDS